MFFKQINFKRSHRLSRMALGLLSSASLCAVLLFASFYSSGLAAAACANTPDSTQGTDTQTINVTSAGTYYVWSRILAPDTTNNSYYLQVDGGCAIDVGDSSSMPAKTWTWVNYQNGASSSVISMNLTAGNHQIVMTGREPGVGVDRLLFLNDPTCVPTGTDSTSGNNCTPPVNTPPTVSITSPVSGATVSGSSVPLSANATDDTTGLSVAFAIDGTTVGTDTSSPYSVNWDSTKVSSGPHTLTAKATDAGGLTTTAQENITVSNTTKSTPTIAISSPANNSTVSGTTNITTAASSGVTNVQFKLDGNNLGPLDTTAPYSYSWDTIGTQVSNGTHTLTAVASDGTNTVTSTPVTVTVNNKSVTPLTISLSAPANNATVSGTVPVSATASSNATSVQFELDGTNLGSADTSSPYTASWDSTKVNNGTHTLTAVASDGTNTTTATPVTVTVNNPVVQTPSTVQNLTWSSNSDTLTWSAYPGASSYVVAEIYNPTTTRNTDYTWPLVTSTSCTPGSSCPLPLPSPGETVNYGILPLDSTNNPVSGSNWAKEITVTLPSSSTSDTTPPSQPLGLTATPVSSSQINLAWSASTDNVGVAGYKIYRSTNSDGSNASLVNTVNTTSYGDTGLKPNTRYTYYVIAVDAAKNQSAQSINASATTQGTSATTIIQGTIISSTTHRPINGVHLYTDSHATANGTESVYTNSQGQYTMTGIIPAPAQHNYYITASGYQSQHYYVPLPAGLNIENLSLTPSGRH